MFSVLGEEQQSVPEIESSSTSVCVCVRACALSVGGGCLVFGCVCYGCIYVNAGHFGVCI